MLKNLSFVLVKHFGILALVALSTVGNWSLVAQTRTWNGTISSDWGTAGNWTPSGIPTSGTVNINSNATPFACVLDANRAIATLNINSGASLDFNGFVLTVSGTSTINDAVLDNTNLTSANFAGFSANTFNGASVLTKTGGIGNNLTGGNEYNGTLTVNNNSTQILRFSNTTGDTYNGNCIFNKNGTGSLRFAHNGNSVFYGNVTINNSLANSISFGEANGTTTITAGNSLLTSGFTGGNLTIRRLTQLGTATNGAFSPASVTVFESSFGGGLTIASTGSFIIDDSDFLENVVFSGITFTVTGSNSFSTVSGNTTITKIGGSSELWEGGNTFGLTTFNNNSTNATVTLANLNADTFNGNVEFNNNGATSGYHIARSGINNFAGNITLNNATGTIQFGGNGGESIIASGGALLTSSYSGGTLTLRRVTQIGTAPNDLFQPATFNAGPANSFGGNFSVNCSGTLTLQTSQFTGTNVFTGNQIALTGANSFSTTSGNTVFTRTSTTAVIWDGGNTFGPVTINNNTTSVLTMANTLGDTYLSTATFNKNSTGNILIATNGTNTFGGNVTVNSTTTGTISFGNSTGTSTISSGSAILTDGYTNGGLTLRGVTQNGTATNGTFQPVSFTSNGTSLGGNFSVTASGDISLTNSSFLANASFTGANISKIGSNNFSTVSGSCSFTKTAGVFNDWAGGNSYGPLTVNNNSAVRITLGNTTGDNFTGLAVFNKNGAGDIQIARSGVNTFGGDVRINNSTAGNINFGINTGTSTIASGFAILTDGFTAGGLTIRGVTQNGSAANASFQPATFTTANGTSLGGDISITATGAISITSSSFLGSNSFSGSSFTSTTSNFPASNVVTATQIDLIGANSFSDVSGNTVFTRTSTTAVTWDGGNTFGPVTINNNTTSVLTMANTLGDTYLSTSTFNKNSTGNILIATNGTNTFNGNVTINSTTAGSIIFGNVNGTSSISSGSAVLTDGFTDGNLTLRGVTQNGTASNGSFQPVNFTAAQNTDINGDISVVASTAISITSSSFRRSNTFTAPSIAVVNANNFSTTSGTTTFTKNGTTINDWTGGNTFGNVVFNMNAASGRLRLASTTLDTYNGNATFLRNAAGAFEPAYNGDNVFNGDISTVGTTNTITFGLGTGRVFFQGSAAQNISGDLATRPVLRRVTLNKTSAANTVTMNIALDIPVDITFVTGQLVSSATNLLTILNAATATNASNSSFVNGPVRKVGNQAFTFPIGNNGFYGPIGISAPAVNTHHFTATYYKDSPNNNGLDVTALVGTLNNVSGCENWDLERTGGTSNVHVTIHWDETRCGGVVVMGDLSVGKWDGSQWTDLGNGSVSGTPALGSITTLNPVTSFSPFTLASTTSANVLPITLTSFEVAATENNDVEVLWTTASERNNDFFTVERSVDGVNWEVVGTVEGQGNSIHSTDYRFVDAFPYSGLSYYRLKQTDYDGVFEYFEPKSVFVTNAGVEMVVYPNPATSVLNISSNDIQNIAIVDASGKTVYSESYMHTSEAQVSVADLQNGMYIVTVSTAKGVVSSRFIKQ